jgi:hypothetical protein
MLQALEQPLAVMVSLFHLLWLISRRGNGMSGLLNIPDIEIIHPLSGKSIWTTAFARPYPITWKIFL